MVQMMNNLRTYTDLSKLLTFKERFEYLKLGGLVGKETFGYDRWLNQKFYTSYEWKRIRSQVIVRDNACDLGISDLPIHGKIFVHHMNPILLKDLIDLTDVVLNIDYLICVSFNTHNAIHYGVDILDQEIIDRKPNDTIPWKK